MYSIDALYNVYGLKSKSNPDIEFKTDDCIAIKAVDSDNNSTMESIVNRITDEFGTFDSDRLHIDYSYPITKDVVFGWHHIDF